MSNRAARKIGGSDDLTHGRYDPGMKVWVRSGWVPIVERAAADLRSVGVDLLEAREKLGALRLHVRAKDVRRADVQKIFRVAGERAARTCDICGNPGILSREAQRRVRCGLHLDCND